MTNVIGRSLGQYQVVEEIGRGGMAIVYKARQASLDRFVALKVLASQAIVDKSFAERFMNEARTAASLEHPNIITIHEVGEVDGALFIAMRYEPGGTLQQLVRKEGALPAPRVLRIVRQLAGALDYAHSRGVIHRDVKPSNVMMGNGDHVVLTDFGIARARESSGLTQTGVAVGTPEYMSPEQAEGRPIDHRTDVYSLAVLVWEMLTGRVPFTGTTPFSVLHKVVYETPPPLRTMGRDVAPAVDKVLRKALAKDASKRYETASAMAEDLAKAMIIAKPPPPYGLLALGALALVGIGAVVLLTRPKVPGSATTPTPLVTAPEMIAALPTQPPSPTPSVTATLGPTATSVRAATSAQGSTATAARSVTSTRGPSATTRPSQTYTRVPSATPTVKPTDTARPSPTATRVKPTAVPAVALDSPSNGQGFEGGSVPLRWHFSRALKEDEYFDVRVWQSGMPHSGVTWTKETAYDAAPAPTGQNGVKVGTNYWCVVVIRQTGTRPDGSKEWVAVTNEGEPRWFNYSGGSGDVNPPPPPPPQW